MELARQAAPARLAHRTADLLLLVSFFISGASALVYQVGWQRALYATIGVDTDSVTTIVSVFMLGIGIGGMLGGWLADVAPRHRLRLYALIELAIGLFGLASLALLPRVVGLLSPHGTAAGSAVACFVFLLVPTTLMGMTLPLLTMAFDERRGNIGISVGSLYFTNTLGAAFGAALVPFVLLPLWPLPQVISVAVVGNLVVMVCAVLAAATLRMQPELA